MSTTAVKRACDACHRRKVKCDGINPCRNCDSAQLTCTYNAIPQKKGPKGSRAKVISELRETQRQTSLSAKIHNRLNGIDSTTPPNPALGPTSGMLSSELVKESIEFYFNNMYSIMPILDRPSLEPLAMFPEQNIDSYCLFTSMCSFMMLQPGMSMPGFDPVLEHVPGSSIVAATLLMEETLRVRKSQDLAGTPTFEHMCTSFFLYCSNYALELHDKAWYYLREAATMALIAGMTKEETYASLGSVESSRKRRLFWLLYVAERAYALKYDRPLSLSASIQPPTMTDDPTDPLAHQLNPFVMLANLFRPFDDTLISQWNKTRSQCTPQYLSGLQKQLAGMMPPYMNGQDAQLTELRIDQQWLKTVAWRLSMPNGCVPQSEDGYHHASVDMSQDLMSITASLSGQNADGHGVQFVSKLLNISCDLTDVLSMQPSSGSMFGNGPREQLSPLLQLISALKNNNHHLMPLLLHKAHELLPRLADPSLQRAPENVNNLQMSVDIFDGFGNAGMAQAPMMNDFKSEPFTPAQVPRMEELVPDSSSSSGTADIKSPFPMVSSPSAFSPGGMEYGQMGDYNTIGDMMNSMAQNQPQPINQQNGMTSQHSHQQQHLSQQQQHAHQHHGMTTQGMSQNSNLSNHMQSNHSQSPTMGGSDQQQNVSPNQGYGHLNQGILNQGYNRPPPQRTNSYMMHQQQQQQQQHNYHSMPQGNSENVPMNSMSMNSMGSAELSFGNMR